MGIVDYIFPKKCLSCKKNSVYICSRCFQKAIKVKNTCIECKKASIDGATHTKCKKPLSLDQSISLWEYKGAIRKTILALKYKFASDVASELIDKFIDELKIPVPKKAVLVPVPIHNKRKKWRGFNQSEELGKVLARELNWEYSSKFLIKTKNTRPQTELKGKQRRENVKGVFKIIERPPKQGTIVLFDDVSTTGSTLKECGKVLKRNGVRKVITMTICG